MYLNYTAERFYLGRENLGKEKLQHLLDFPRSSVMTFIEKFVTKQFLAVAGMEKTLTPEEFSAAYDLASNKVSEFLTLKLYAFGRNARKDLADERFSMLSAIESFFFHGLKIRLVEIYTKVLERAETNGCFTFSFRKRELQIVNLLMESLRRFRSNREKPEHILQGIPTFELKKQVLDFLIKHERGFEINAGVTRALQIEQLEKMNEELDHLHCAEPCGLPSCAKVFKRRRLQGPGYSSDSSADGPVVTRYEFNKGNRNFGEFYMKRRKPSNAGFVDHLPTIHRKKVRKDDAVPGEQDFKSTLDFEGKILTAERDVGIVSFLRPICRNPDKGFGFVTEEIGGKYLITKVTYDQTKCVYREFTDEESIRYFFQLMIDTTRKDDSDFLEAEAFAFDPEAHAPASPDYSGMDSDSSTEWAPEAMEIQQRNMAKWPMSEDAFWEREKDFEIADSFMSEIETPMKNQGNSSVASITHEKDRQLRGGFHNHMSVSELTHFMEFSGEVLDKWRDELKSDLPASEILHRFDSLELKKRVLDELIQITANDDTFVVRWAELDHLSNLLGHYECKTRCEEFCSMGEFLPHKIENATSMQEVSKGKHEEDETFFNWAMTVSEEGIFLEFSGEVLDKWRNELKSDLPASEILNRFDSLEVKKKALDELIQISAFDDTLVGRWGELKHLSNLLGYYDCKTRCDEFCSMGVFLHHNNQNATSMQEVSKGKHEEAELQHVTDEAFCEWADIVENTISAAKGALPPHSNENATSMQEVSEGKHDEEELQYVTDEAFCEWAIKAEKEFFDKNSKGKRLFGPEFSGDNSGDGPPMLSSRVNATKREAIAITPGATLGFADKRVKRKCKGETIIPGDSLRQNSTMISDYGASSTHNDVMDVVNDVESPSLIGEHVLVINDFNAEVVVVSSSNGSMSGISNLINHAEFQESTSSTPQPIAYTEHYLGSCDRRCPFCGARFWCSELNSKRKYLKCCRNGSVSIPTLHPPTALFRDLFGGTSTKSKLFFKRIRVYNTNLSFASIEMHEETFSGHGVPSLSIMGSVYHKMGGLRPNERERPKFLQTYFFDTSATDSGFYQGNERVLMNEIRGEIKEINSIIHGISERFSPIVDLRSEIGLGEIILKDTPLDPTRMQHCFQAVTSSEVSGLLLDQGGQEVRRSREIQVRLAEGPLLKIASDHSSYDPLAYVLFHPFGEIGWSYEMNRARKGITCREFYRNRMHFRDSVHLEYDMILKGRQLTQQYFVDMYAKIEEHEMKFIRMNQKRLKAELYCNLQDAMGEGDELNAGKKFILPSSVVGSPRAMYQMFLDSLAVVQNFGKPSLFITMTCNPEWREIKEELRPGEEPWMRPDIVARVWEMKRKAFLDDVLKEHVFGRVVAYMYTIEFQKRGLPHLHLLVILHPDDEIRTTEDIDRVVSAEIPDPELSPELHAVVCKFHLHGPCGCYGPNRPCMQNDNHCCRFFFPQKFEEETRFLPNAYPAYRRRSPELGGREYKKGDFTFDNRWCIPYPPKQVVKYKCHINVEVTTSIKSVKYVYKYTTKGPDLTTIGVRSVDDLDEIKKFQEARYISPHFAFYRIFEFPMSGRYPNVERLPVHLPNQQVVTYEEGDEYNALENGEHSKLISYFDAVLNEIQNPLENPYQNIRASDLTYVEFPKHYCWKATSKQWSRRKQPKVSDCVGRMYNVSIGTGEKYYLRRLLSIVKGAYSYEVLRTIDGILYDTFKSACGAYGLLADDREWHNVLREASEYSSPCSLRNLFGIILTQNQPTNPMLLWETFKDFLSEDKLNERRTLSGNRAYNFDVSDYNECLYDLEDLLKSMKDVNVSLKTYALPQPQIPRRQFLPRTVPDFYDVEEQRKMVLEYEGKLNIDQRYIYDTVLNECQKSTEDREFNSAFVDAPGGTGKTFTFKAVLAKVRANGDVAIAVGTSAISAILLPGGGTAHSIAKIPIPCTEDSLCHLTRRSQAGKLFMTARILIWDEAIMIDRKSIECFDRSMRDLRRCDRMFGGLFVLFGGDFRQLLPVVLKGSRAQIVNACIMRSYLWDSIKKLSLTVNERVMRNGDHAAFCEFLLKVGENKIQNSKVSSKNCIQLPDDILFHGAINDLIDWVYDDLYNVDINAAILTAWNSEVDKVNDLCLRKLTLLREFSLRSSDTLTNDNLEHFYPIEFLNSLCPSGFPLHNLKLKIGAPVILLRNIDPKRGLCNGTRLKITHVTTNIIRGTISNGTHSGLEATLPRILFSTDDSSPYSFTRRQFPVKLAYALTINKSQGQSLSRIGVYLPRPLFNHGGLYVALSRSPDPRNIRVLIEQVDEIQGKFKETSGFHTRNIVYTEVFS